MCKRMKRILSAVLAALLLVSSVPIETSTANAMDHTKDTIANGNAQAEETISFEIRGERIESDLNQMQPESTEESGFYQVREATRNVTDQIKHTTTIRINGKKYTGGAIQVSKGDNFSYEYIWSPDFQNGGALQDGDYFEKVLFRVPHLKLVSNVNQNLVISGVKVGEWTLQYNEQSGEMKYRVMFNKYIQLFDMHTIEAQLQGSGSFQSVSNGSEDIHCDEFDGKIEIIERPVPPVVPPVVGGTGWEPPKPPTFTNETLRVGKGHRWNNKDKTNETPQIEWRIGFMEQLQKKQQELLDNNQVTPFTGNCIIEETLDENMRYHYQPKENNSERFGKSPFHIELPVIIAGTNQVLNGPIGDANYDGFGRISPYIRGEDLKEIDGSMAITTEEVKQIQNEVRKTPCSWTVTTDPVTKKQTLMINLGVLGGTDPAKGITWSMSKGDQRWPLEGIQSNIDQCENTIRALDSGSNSPFKLLGDRHQRVVNLLMRALQLPVNQEVSEQMELDLEQWQSSYRNWYDHPAVGALKPLENAQGELIVALPEIQLLHKLLDIPVHENGTKLKDTKEYKDFSISFDNIRTDQKIYLEHRADYRSQWESAKERYVKTLQFYKDKPIYGFTLNCRTTSVNTSVEQYTNHVKISIGEQSWSADDEVKVQFSNRVTGSFALGSLVIQKADEKYDVKELGKDEQKQQMDNINQVGKDHAGIAGAKFQVYCEDAATGALIQDEKHLVRFLDKNASPNRDTYIHKPDSGNVTEVITDGNGKLVLGGLSPLHAHYLVETEAPEGYYTDQKPIRLQTETNKVLYHLVPNTSRAVKLVKQDSYTKHKIAGAEFALTKGNQKITGFRKKMVKGKEVLVPDPQGKERLLTDAQGELCIHNLSAGTYTLEEIKPAPGYQLPEKSKSYTFELKDQFDATQPHMDAEKHLLLNNGMPVKNDPKTAEVTINKIEGNKKTPLEGATFAIFRFTGNEEEWKKNPNDYTKWKAVSYPEGTKKYFQTKQRVETVTLPSIPGGDQSFSGVLTDSHGKVTITDIPLGHYSIAEIKPPEFYHRDENNYYFHVTAENVGTSVQIYRGLGTEQKVVEENRIFNYQRLSQIKLVKGDSQQMPTIVGTKVNEGFRYEGSEIQGTGLPGATFKLFRRAGSGGMNPNKEELKTTTIVGTASSPSGKKYDPCLAVGTTNADGILDLKDMRDENGNAIEGLHMDRYYMIEVQAPEGYRLNQTPIMFTIDSDVYPTDSNNENRPDGTPGLVVAVSNQRYVYAIKLMKRDATSQKPMGKVGFSLSKEDGTPVYVSKSPNHERYMVDENSKRATMYTDQDGELFVGGLEPGTTYIVTETQVPNGYEKMRPIKVTTPISKENGKVYSGFLYTEQVVENRRLSGIPVTGIEMNATSSKVLFGIGLGGAILLIVITYGRRREQDR